MRGTRWLLLVAIAAIIFGVGVTYRKQKESNRENAPAAPEPMPDGLSSTFKDWSWTKKNQTTGCRIVVSAKGMNQVQDSSRSEISDVTLQMFHKVNPQDLECSGKFDLVRTAAGTFFDSENRLVSDGDVFITLGETDPPSSLISIKSSGVTLETESGKADTEKPTTFVFKNGQGSATGATYDPGTKDVVMKHDVIVDWEAATKHAKPMHIETPTLVYHEAAAEIDMTPTGHMTRDALVFDGENPILRLIADGDGHKFIKEIDATHARGSDVTPGRKLAYSADRVWVFYNDDHLVERIVAEGNAALTSTAESSQTETSQTDVNASRVEMFFEMRPKENDAGHMESQLARVVCDGKAVVSSKPLPVPGKAPADSHVLSSEHIVMKMRPGGKDIETVSANPSGVLEFLPNVPTNRHRTLRGDDMLITYAPKNHIEGFHATNATTTTDPNAEELKRKRPVSRTSSKDFSARFEPNSSELATMEQTGSFSYQEGDRKAHANKATFDRKQNVMTLDTGAGVSDATGSTSADHIRLDQNTDDFVADGNVTSSRLPDKDQKNNSSMLSGDAPLNAQARKMEYRASKHQTRYEGNARLWQGANRITAEVVEVDRDKHTLTADGNVVTEAWEQPKDDAKKKSTAAVKTIVNAPHLVYTDKDRLAYYFGGVKLERPELHLKSKELHAWLNDSKAESQLEKAFADGGVEISGARKDNSYSGNSEHLEYYTKNQTVILNGGNPQLRRSAGGKETVMKEPELIYSLDDGNLKGHGLGSDRLPPKKK